MTDPSTVMTELLQDVRIVTQLEVSRLALGFTRPRMAAAIQLCCAEGGGMCADTLKRYERRLTNLFALFDDALCKYFAVGSVALLGVGSDPGVERWWTWMTPEEIVAETLDRRDLLRDMGKVVGAAGLLLPVSDLVAAAQQLGLVGDKRNRHRRIGNSHVARARETATRIAVAYATDPAARTLRAAKVHAYTLFDLLEPNRATMSDEVRTDLQAVASDAAALAGYGDLNAGRLDDADRWFRCAGQLAHEAGDRRLEALALASRAWVPLYQPEPDRAAVVAGLEAAAGYQSVLRPAGRAWVFGYLARECAALGDDPRSGRFLAKARQAAALIPHDDPGWGWWSTRAELPLRLDMIGATRSLLLGRPAAALAVFDAALASTTKPVTLAYHHERNAQACIALDDLDRACTEARTCLAVAKAYGLGLASGELRKVRAAFPHPWGGHPQVVELDELLRLAA